MGINFPSRRGGFPKLLGYILFIGLVLLASCLSVRFIGPHPSFKQIVGYIVRFTLCSVALLIGAGWFTGMMRLLVRDVRAVCLALYDRRRVIATISDFDRSKLNSDYRYEYLSYNNVLLRLYMGPDFMGRLLWIHPGIEEIDAHAFDYFGARHAADGTFLLNERIRGLALPKTLKRLDPACIPNGMILAFEDTTTKAVLHGSEDELRRRGVKVTGALFTELLDACVSLGEDAGQLPETVGWYDFSDVVGALPQEFAGWIVNAVSAVRTPELAERAMDMVHEQILAGNIAPDDFRKILSDLDNVDHDRYTGDDVIERLYGSRELAIEKYARKYYKAEQERRQGDKTHRMEEIVELARAIEALRNEDIRDDQTSETDPADSGPVSALD